MESLTISNGVQEIGNYAFNWCVKLQNLVIPHSVTIIGESSFSRCESLESLELGNHSKEIPKNAFSNCYKLVSLSLGKDLEILGEGAFAGCNSLDSLELGSNVKEINDYAFTSCSSLKSLSLPDNVTAIGNYAFSSCKNLTNLNIPSSITSIGNYAFSECGNLLDLNLGTNVQNIGNCAFWGCTILKSLDIPNTVRSIGQSAFEGCDSLLTLSLGSSLTEIGEKAFFNCRSLENIYSKPAQPVNIAQSVFSMTEQYKDYHGRTLTRTVFNNHPVLSVPKTSEELYREHDVWKLFLIKPQMKMLAYYDNPQNDANSYNIRKKSSEMEGNAYTDDEDNIEVEGVTADGVSKVRLLFEDDFEQLSGDELTFKINGEEIDKADKKVGTCGTIQRFNDGKWGFVYTAPDDYLCDGNEYTINIEAKFFDKNGATITGNANIRVMRPGVILLHGFLSDKGCFKDLYNYLITKGGYERYQVLNQDYEESHTTGFDINTHTKKIVDTRIKILCKQLLNAYGIVATKFDLVGHSMGGILSRKYAQEVCPDSVNRIITLDTPHHGSEIPEKREKFLRIVEHQNNIYSNHFEIIVINNFILELVQDKEGLEKYGAIKDLGTNSAAIKQLNDHSDWKPNANIIPVHAICSSMIYDDLVFVEIEYYKTNPKYQKVPRSTVPSWMKFQKVLGDDGNPLVVANNDKEELDNFFGGANDGIVSLVSQLSGSSEKATYVTIEEDVFKGPIGWLSNAHHCKTNHWIKSFENITNVLHSSKESEKFCKLIDGFKAPSINGSAQIKTQTPNTVIDFQEPKERQ